MLTELPVVVVDTFLDKYVDVNDLRAIHQVSKEWKNLIETRPSVNAKRLALLTKIREHKENIRKSTQPLVLPAEATQASRTTDERNPKNKENHDDKTGSGRVLRNLSNRLLETPATSAESSTANSGTRRRNTRISSTPKSRFQRRYEAGLKLMPGQVLFSCPGCNSPVPSPLPASTSISRDEKPISVAEVSTFETLDSEISMVSSLYEELTQLTRCRIENSTVFKFNTPDMDSSINISMIATPPCTPNNLEPGIVVEFGSIETVVEFRSIETEGPLRDLERRSPSCPFLNSTSTISISECSLPLDVNGNQHQSLPTKDKQHVVVLGDTIEPEMNESQDSGIAECTVGEELAPIAEVSQSTNVCPSEFIEMKKLKIRSCSSPSLLVSEVKDRELPLSNTVNTSPALPVVIQCPDCSLRFCSQCKFSEHAGKPCRVLGGDEMYDDEDEDFACHNSFFPRPTSRPPPSKPRARSATSTTTAKSNKKKGSLRRLAYL